MDYYRLSFYGLNKVRVDCINHPRGHGPGPIEGLGSHRLAPLSVRTATLSPPPAAPPVTFIVGPREGCLMVAITFFPFFPSPWVRPIVVVDFPSPSGVGVMAVTSTYLPFGLSARRFRTLA